VTCVAYTRIERSIYQGAGDQHFTPIGEFDRITWEIEKNLRQPAFVAPALRKIRTQLNLLAEFFSAARGSTALKTFFGYRQLETTWHARPPR
jgi:hypothetical protein